jgi:phosphomannomutase
MGVDVVDLGVISTDMLYFAVNELKADCGLTVTGSYTPGIFNGFKLVKNDGEPIFCENGLMDIKKLVEKANFNASGEKGEIDKVDVFDAYIKKILSFVDAKTIRGGNFRVVANMNNGVGGRVVSRLAKELNIELEKLNFEPDGTFPKGRPDPMIPELRTETRELVKTTEAHLGAAWDADADRCFLFDEYGRFVDAYYMSALLSRFLLKKHKGAAIVHDPRLIWAIDDTIKEYGGKVVTIRAGHSFIKEAMRKNDAIFASETSGHFYFKDYYYCDNGMIPFLMILEKMAKTGKKLSVLVDPIRFKYPVSEEVNFKVTDSRQVLKDLEDKNKEGKITHIDGLSVEYPGEWRFNIRASHTGEALVRLNVEAVSREILDPMKAEIIRDIKKDIALD